MSRKSLFSGLSILCVMAALVVAPAAAQEKVLRLAQPPKPSWGGMLADTRSFLLSAPWLPIYPGLAIFLASLGFNLLGDGLRDALDVKQR